MRRRHEVFRKSGNIGYLVFLLSLPALPAQQIVTSALDSCTGSLRSAISLASPGDTVVFNIPGKDTILLLNGITIVGDLSIDGINKPTGNRVVVLSETFEKLLAIAAGNVSIRHLILDRGEAEKGGDLYVVGPTTSVVLDNVVVRNGRASGSYYGYGGGVYLESGILTIANGVIANNQCSGSYSGYGGGIYNSSGTMNLINDTLTANSSTGYGGGAYNESGVMTLSGCAVIKNKSLGNGAYTGGGGIYNNNGDLSITGGTVSNNSSLSRAGGIYNASGNVTLTNATVSNDTAGWSYAPSFGSAYASTPSESPTGGGIFNDNGAVSIIGSTLSFNCASAYATGVYNSGNDLRYFAYEGCGGGIFNSGGPLTIVNSTFCGNNASSSASSGQSNVGIYSIALGGGIYNDSGPVTILNSTFSNNSVNAYANTYSWSIKKVSSSGAFLQNHSGNVTIIYGTVAENSCGISSDTGMISTLNSILADNKGSELFYTSNVHCMNTMFGMGNPPGAVNSTTGVSARALFGTPAPLLADNNGTPQTISLGTQNSIAIGKGIRAGTYTIIENSGRQWPVLKAAYLDTSIADWRALESDERIPPQIMVNEITTDERGKARSTPPCAGAFEFTANEPVRKTATVKITEPMVFLTQSGLHILVVQAGGFGVELFDLAGKRMLVKKIAAVQGTNVVSLPSFAQKALLCRITMPFGVMTKKLSMVR